MVSRVRLQDIAQYAGVSTATVSRVLNQPEMVSPETRQRVESAAETLQFQARDRNRHQTARATRTIAVVLSHLDWPVVPDWLAEVHHTITGAGYNTIVAASEGGSSIRQHCARLILDGQADGAIFYSPHGETYTSIVEQLGIPNPLRHGRGLYCLDIRARRGFYVLIDEEQVGRLAASHLISAGASQIALIGGPSNLATARVRQEAFLSNVAALGRPRDAVLVEPTTTWNFESGYAAMDALLARHEPIDGLFVTCDNAALGAIRLLHERGIEIPGGMAIVSVDNMVEGVYSIPSLTTIDIRVRERAALAASELIHLLEDPAAEPRDITVSVKLVVRESSRLLARRAAG